MEVRPATADDVPDIGRVHATSRRATYAALVPAAALAAVTPEAQAEHWRLRLATAPPPSAVYVVVADGSLQGFAMGSGHGHTATLDALHVLPSLQGTGAGQRLHDRLVADFVAWGCAVAELWVLEGNERAQSFYLRNGWRADGTRHGHDVGGVDVPAVRYRRPLTG
jgi:GNAT superfamily N-acetyltransferase